MWKIPLFKIYWDEKDVEYIISAIKKGMYWAEGPNIEKFEKMMFNRTILSTLSRHILLIFYLS